MTDPLATARVAQRHIDKAEHAARAARERRADAVMAAYRAGLKPQSIADGTGFGLELVRKIIRENRGA